MVVVKDPVKHKLMVHMTVMASLVYNHFCVTRHVAFVLLPECVTLKRLLCKTGSLQAWW